MARDYPEMRRHSSRLSQLHDEDQDDSLTAEASGVHLASDDYPEMGSILTDRPDPGAKITVVGYRRQAADSYGGDEDPRAGDYNGGENDSGTYWAEPGQQHWMSEHSPQEEAPPPPWAPSVIGAEMEGEMPPALARLAQLEEARHFFGMARHEVAPASQLASRGATTINGTQVDDHGDAPEHGTVPRASEPNAYDERSTEGDGDPKWSGDADPEKHDKNSATVGMYPEGMSGGSGPGLEIGAFVASLPYQGHFDYYAASDRGYRSPRTLDLWAHLQKDHGYRRAELPAHRAPESNPYCDMSIWPDLLQAHRDAHAREEHIPGDDEMPGSATYHSHEGPIDPVFGARHTAGRVPWTDSERGTLHSWQDVPTGTWGDFVPSGEFLGHGAHQSPAEVAEREEAERQELRAEAGRPYAEWDAAEWHTTRPERQGAPEDVREEFKPEEWTDEATPGDHYFGDHKRLDHTLSARHFDDFDDYEGYQGVPDYWPVSGRGPEQQDRTIPEPEFYGTVADEGEHRRYAGEDNPSEAMGLSRPRGGTFDHTLSALGPDPAEEAYWRDHLMQQHGWTDANIARSEQRGQRFSHMHDTLHSAGMANHSHDDPAELLRAHELSNRFGDPYQAPVRGYSHPKRGGTPFEDPGDAIAHSAPVDWKRSFDSLPLSKWSSLDPPHPHDGDDESLDAGPSEGDEGLPEMHDDLESPDDWPLAQTGAPTGPAYTQGRHDGHGGRVFPPPPPPPMPAGQGMPGEEPPGIGGDEDGEAGDGAPGGKKIKIEIGAHLDAFVAAASSAEFRFHFTAAWSDVVAKAKRLRKEGYVRITHASRGLVVGEVRGDHDTYESGIQRPPGKPQTIQHWACGCPWASFHQDRSLGTRYAGRPCSHVMALQFEAQARGMFGKSPAADEARPSWFRDEVTVKSWPPYEGEPHGGHWNRYWLAPSASLKAEACSEDGHGQDCHYHHPGDCPADWDDHIAESLRHSRPSDFHSEIALNPKFDPHDEEETPGADATHVLYGFLGGRPAGTLHFSVSDDGQAHEVHMLHTRSRPEFRSKGVASAMMDDLYSHVKRNGRWLDHGWRTSHGNNWWASYREPYPELNTHHAHPDEGWKDYWSPSRVSANAAANFSNSGGRGVHTPLQYRGDSYPNDDRDDQWASARGLSEDDVAQVQEERSRYRDKDRWLDESTWGHGPRHKPDWSKGASLQVPAHRAMAALLASGEDPGELIALATLVRTADQANAPWGADNVSDHPPVKPYGATSPPNKDQDPGSYGPLSAPDPENWGGIQEGAYTQMPLSNTAVLQDLGFQEDQETHPYTDQSGTAGPSTSISPGDPNGIRMDGTLRQAVISVDGPDGDLPWTHDTYPDAMYHAAAEARRTGQNAYVMDASRAYGRPAWIATHDPLSAPQHEFTPEGAHHWLASGDHPAPPMRRPAWDTMPQVSEPSSQRNVPTSDQVGKHGLIHDPVFGWVTEAALAELRDEPEPALPSTTGDDQEEGEGLRERGGIDGTMGDAQDAPHEFAASRLHGGCAVCGLDRSLRVHATSMGDLNRESSPQGQYPDMATQEPGMGSMDDALSPQDPSIQTIGNQQWSGGGADSDEVDVPAGQPGGSLDDIVAAFQRSAAARGLNGGGGGAQSDGDIAAAARQFLKTADVLPHAEAEELISEGAGQRARNLGLLRLEGTHYEDLGDERGDEVEDDLVWA